MNAHQARDASRDRTQSIEDKFLADAASSADVVATARAAAVAEVEAKQKEEFDAEVETALEKASKAPDGGNEPNTEKS